MEAFKKTIQDAVKNKSLVIEESELLDLAKWKKISFHCPNGHSHFRQAYFLNQNILKNEGTFHCHTCAIASGKVKCLRSNTKASPNVIRARANRIGAVEMDSESGECWMKILEPFDAYSVSNFGHVRNDRTKKVLQPEETNDGYQRVVLCGHIDKQLVRSKSSIHRLVADAFLPMPDNPDQVLVDHLNSIRTDNRAVNLKWSTQLENMAHRLKETKIRDTSYNKDLMTPSIEWRPYKNGDIDIFVSNTGLIRTGDVITDGHVKASYRRFKDCSVHRLVAETFLPLPENYKELVVNHKNGNKEDNRVENLEWITHAENSAHASNSGLLDFRKKKIKQYDLNCNFIKEYPSQVDASKESGISEDNINNCVRKMTQSAGGFIWRFSDDNSELKPVLKGSREVQKRKFGSDEVVSTYESIAKAASELSFSAQKVKKMADRREKLDDEYYLSFSTEGEGKKFSEKSKAVQVERLSMDKQTVLVKYTSIKKAAKECKMGEATIKKLCEMDKSDKDGFFWKFVY